MFLNPLKIVDNFDIRPAIKVADFGCGSGHFTIEISKRIGKDGTVYAFDIQEEVLNALKSRMALENITNVELRRVDLELEQGTALKDGLVDFVLIANILFQAEEKAMVLKEAFRILKSGGRMAVIEWKDEGGGLGPPPELRVKKDHVSKLLSEAGFILLKEFDAGTYHYGLILQKP